jgi:glycosidase
MAKKLLSLFAIVLLILQMLPAALTSQAETTTGSPSEKVDVTFTYHGGQDVTKVQVAGDFNNWAADGEKAVTLNHQSDNVWSVTESLEPGSYAYKFIVNGNWVKDPENPLAVDDGYGGQNSVLIAPSAQDSKEVVLVGDLQAELGAGSDWSPSDTTTQLINLGNGSYIFAGNLKAGDYQYKIAIGGSWDENYGAGGAGGGNINLHLDKDQTVLFYYNDVTHSIADSTRYIPLPYNERPRVAGDFQDAIGAGSNWSPDTSTAFLTDDNFDSIYTYQTILGAGHHEFKIVLGDSWQAQAYPSSNATVDMHSKGEVTFLYDAKTHEVKTQKLDMDAGDIQYDHLYHNTMNLNYREPFGAIKAGSHVTLRLRAAKGDLTAAKLSLTNQTTGETELYDMTKAGTTVIDGDKADIWAVTITPKEKGVYGYKFIAIDRKTQGEYGEDQTEGGTGKAVESDAQLFQLTVYDPSYKTPDWMKGAVVYQIFPDRFKDGDPKNDNAKQYSRGFDPIEHREWSQLPDNPNLKDTPGYDGDGIWTNDFFGGDIKGIREKLGYIQSLGVNTIYLNPINDAASNHKYDATNYKDIDPMFGTPEEFKAFTNELHNRGMHLIVDGVFNHVGDDSVYFDRYGKYPTVGAYEYWSRIYDLMNEKGLSKDDAIKAARQQFIKDGQVFSDYGFENWFNIQNEKVNVGKPDEHYKYQCWWGYDSLPEIASVAGVMVDHNSELNNQDFANYIFKDKDSVAKTWLNRGASGWRLDVANEVDPDFWRAFRNELKSHYTSPTGDTPLILGEIWDDASKYFLGDLYDSVMNYRFRGAVLNYLQNGQAENAEQSLMAIREDYPSQAFYALMNLIGSHDTARAAYLLGGGSDSKPIAEMDPNYDKKLGIERLKLAATFQMGYPGAPTIYYGDEAGVTGSKDPDDRRTYPWDDPNKDLVNYYQTLGNARTKYHDLFSKGDIQTVYAKGDVYIYARHLDTSYALVAINRGNQSEKVTVDLKGIVPNGALFKDQIVKDLRAEVKDGAMTLTIPGLTGRMFVANHVKAAFPAKVADIEGTEGSHQISLKWKAADVDHYNIYLSTVDGAFYKKVETTKDTSITLGQLQNGTRYYAAVTAVDSSGNESEMAMTAALIPHIPLVDGQYSLSGLTDLSNGVIDLSQPENVGVSLWVKGETEAAQADGVLAKLQVKAPGEDSWQDYSATYTGQVGESNRYEAEFLPIQPGEYTYRMAISTDASRSWVYSDSQTVSYELSQDDTIPPAKTVTLNQPKKEAGQVNLSWSMDGASDPYMIEVLRDGVLLDQIWDGFVTTYKDITVKNEVTYHYQVRVYDVHGNTVTSNDVAVTPGSVMIDVTFNVHAPDYTPLDAQLTIPGSLNGWNTSEWQMTRGGAVTTDWSYTVKLPVGTDLTYKYVRDGTWDHEGLSDHTPNDTNDDDVSYYGYGAPGTDLHVTVTNQGDNKMVINDTILRWIDQPVVITSPANGATVHSSTVTIKGNAIKDGLLSINGESVPINDDMTFSHDVTLSPGENTITIHVEPKLENETTIFKGDSGAIGKATKDITYTINYQ